METKHEKLAIRLTGILIKLNSGNRVSAKQLAEEYKVSLKTVKRELYEQLDKIPLLTTETEPVKTAKPNGQEA